MKRRSAHLCAALIIPMGLLQLLLPAYWRPLAEGLTSIICGEVIVLGIKRNRPATPLGWYLVASALVLAGIDELLGLASLPGTEQAALGGGLGIVSLIVGVTGVMLWLRARQAGWNLSTLLDTIALLVAVGLVFWDGILEELSRSNWFDAQHVSLLIATTVQIGLMTLVVRLSMSGRDFPIALRYYAISLCCSTLGTLVMGVANATIAGFVLETSSVLLLAAAALHPSMVRFTEPMVQPRQAFSVARFALLGLALLEAPLIIVVEHFRTGATLDLVWLVTSVVLIITVLCRVAMLFIERDGAQYALQESERRFRSLADLGSKILGSTSPREAMAEGAFATHQALNATAVAVWERVSADTLVVRASTGVEPLNEDDTELTVEGESPESRCINENTIVITTFGPESGHPLSIHGDHWAVVAPIKALDRTLGVVAAYFTIDNKPSDSAVPVIEQVANLVALCLERSETEREDRQNQKLEAVGRLAAGIAHEINTPIQFVGDNLHFLKTAFEGLIRLHVDEASDVDLDYLREEVPLAIQQSQDGMQRVAGIVKAMKAFGHPDQTEQVSADLNMALENTLMVARNELKYVADVKTRFGKIPNVSCYVGELNQVFLNLLVNAAHAIADAHETEGRRGRIDVITWTDQKNVYVAIGDNGGGIPRELRHKVWEPFFTTKEVGRGTGQGLSMVKAVVERHGGVIKFDSDPTGTVFSIKLPINGIAKTQGGAAAMKEPDQTDAIAATAITATLGVSA